MEKNLRSAYVYALPCLCLIVFFILYLEATQTSTLWGHHLQHLATASMSTLRNFSSIAGLAAGSAGAVSASVVSIEAGPCTCSLQLPAELLDLKAVPSQHISCRCGNASSSSSSTTTQQLVPNPSLGNLSSCNGTEKLAEPDQTTIVTKPPEPSCPPTSIVVNKVYEEPWYVQGRHWHYPAKFPRCTMDACFNYSRCAGSKELLIYTYDQPAAPAKYFRKLNESKYKTDDPTKACLFFVFLDTPGIYRASMHPRELPFWEGGLNHVLITLGDTWSSKGPSPESIGYASVMATVMYQTLCRPEFDVSIPLPPKYRFANLRLLKPFDRKYLLTFRGLRYLQNEGVLRGDPAFLGLHNGNDVVVVTSCRHANHQALRHDNATLDTECTHQEALYDSYNYGDLMNSTFGLAPAGRQPSTYRFAEILSAGSIPLLLVDNYVKPFDTLVQWHRCVLQFPSTEMHRILGAVRSMKREEVERRQRYCVEIYLRYFSSDDTLLEASIEAQKTRFMGLFPAWTGNITRK